MQSNLDNMSDSDESDASLTSMSDSDESALVMEYEGIVFGESLGNYGGFEITLYEA